MNLSAGSRSFTRYGYGDLLKENRKYDVVYRIWRAHKDYSYGVIRCGKRLNQAYSVSCEVPVLN
jgi:hypothetical protein